MLTAVALRFAWANLAAVDIYEFRYDSTVYDMLARALSVGFDYVAYDGTPTAYFPPGYPWLLSIAYRVWGAEPVVAWAFNALCGGITCGLTYVLGARLYGSRVGTVAAATFAFFPGDVFYAGVTMSEPLFGAVFTGLLVLLVRWSDPSAIAPPAKAFVLGLLLGAAALIRGVALPFVAVPIAFWASSRRHRPRAWQLGAALVLGLSIVTTPWLVRNTLRMGAPVFSTDAALAFWQRHSPTAFGSQDQNTSAAWSVKVSALQQLPNPRREVALYEAAMRSSLRYVVKHPWRDVALTPATIGYLFEHDHWAFAFAKSYVVTESGGEQILFSRERDRLWERVADAYFFGVLVLAVLALPRMLLDRDGIGWIVALTLAYFLFVHGFLCFGEARYHAPLTPVFSVMAAATLVRAWRAATARGFQQAMAGERHA